MDVFAKGKPVYFFQNFDVKNNLPLDDETYMIILNTKCNPKLVPERLKPLYAYINDRNICCWIKRRETLRKAVQKAARDADYQKVLFEEFEL